MKIGVFDSGIGGITVVKSLLKYKLFEEIVYYGDTARVPYGVKDENSITRYALEALEFFKNFKIDLLIVACNTVSAYALEALKERVTFEVVGVIQPGIFAIQNTLKNRDANILILGTKATINSRIYENLLINCGFTNIDSIATGLFVPMVEENITSGEIINSTMKHYFKDFNTPDAVILGCTHFPLIANEISNFFNNKTIIISSGEAIVDYLKLHFDFALTFSDTKLKIFASENPNKFKATAYKWLYENLV